MFKRYWWIFLMIAAIGMFAGFMTAAVITYVMPKKFESHATIEIKAHENSSASNPAPQVHFPSDFARIKTRNTLMKVVESLDLANRWALDPESAVQVLKQIITVENIRGTDLCNIRVLHTNKEDARDIAAETVRAYKAYTWELARNESEAHVSRLKMALREQEDRTEERRKILSIIAKNKGEAGGDNPVDTQDYADAKRELESELRLLEQLKLQLVNEEISQGLAGESIVVHEDPVIAAAPVSPNVSFNLMMGLGAGLLLGFFLAALVMALMPRAAA